MAILLLMVLLTVTIFAEIIMIMVIQAGANVHKVSFKNEACRLYKYNKRFRILVIFAVMLNIQLIIFGAWHISAAVNNEECTVHIVQGGDTLWNIAYEKYGDTVDTRKVIDAIVRLNGIDDCNICPGDVIKIPETVR